MFVTEVHYTDIYPASFLAFRKKYLALLRKRQTYGLYVQFSNNSNNTMDRNAFQKPDHGDMVGVYAYPIDYVLRYPADIWYGHGARYMRVLRDHSRRKIDLRSIDTQNKAERLLNSMGFGYRETMTLLDTAMKTYKHKGVTRWGKIVLSAIQMDLLNAPIAPAKRGMFGSSPPEYRTRTGLEQTALFRTAGYDAIEDTGSSNKQAVLNEREPQQIVFLTRAAFRVVEVYNLRPGLRAQDLPTITTIDPSNSRVERPFAAMIARAMDDRLSEVHQYGKHMYWTQAGRRIEIEFDRQPSYYTTRQMGEKKHKEYKLADTFRPSVTVFAERGKFERHYSGDETFKDIALDVARWWHNAAGNATDWQPESRQLYDEKLKAAEHRALLAQLDAEQQKRIAMLPNFLEDVDWVAQRYGLRFEPNADYEHNEWLIRLLDWLSNFWRHHGGDAIDTAQMRDGITWLRDNLEAPKSQDLIPQWDQLGDILLTAWERDIQRLEGRWLFLRGGSEIFHNTRELLS